MISKEKGSGYKPLGRKNYGSIPHLPLSRMGPGDHKCSEGQARIATERARDQHDRIFCTEKLDGSNVGIVRIGDAIFPLGRAGYLAASSPYLQHRLFSRWAYDNADRFLDILDDSERLVGEWLWQAHGTRYNLPHEPFVAFDIMVGAERILYDDLEYRLRGHFVMPALLGDPPDPVSIQYAMELLATYGYHGATDPVEGAVWRVERNKLIDKHSGKRKWVVDFLVKYVRPDKIDGQYLQNEYKDVAIINGHPTVYEWELGN